MLLPLPECDMAVALVAGGQAMDELQGSAILEVRGDVAARLLRGERVTSLLILGNTLELRNLPGMVSEAKVLWDQLFLFPERIQTSKR